MMTRRNMRLLAAADPWGLETGGSPGIGLRTDLGSLGVDAADVPIIGSDVEAGGKAGEKISAGLEAGDVNAVAEGMEEGIAAVESGAAKLDKAWSDAEKFFMFMSFGTVTAPVLGAKVTGPAAAKGIRLPMWGVISKAKAAQVRAAGGTISQVTVKTPQEFMDRVADGWLFHDSSWGAFTLDNPKPGGVYGEVWNPFAGRWQAQGQDIPQVDSPEAIAQAAEVSEERQAYIDNTAQRHMDSMAKNMEAYIPLARLRVMAKRYKAAWQGAIYEGQMPWGLLAMMIVLTGKLHDNEMQRAMFIDAGHTFSIGPLKGVTYRKQRIKWVQALQKTVATIPSSALDALPGDNQLYVSWLNDATVDSVPGGKLISELADTGNGYGSTTTKGFGAGAAVVGAGLLAALAFFFA